MINFVLPEGCFRDGLLHKLLFEKLVMLRERILNILLVAGFVVCLGQLWWPHFYVTGDGPCHVYNARVLHDLWLGVNKDFYSRFFEVSNQPNPNWCATVLLSLPMFLFNGAVSEKLFLTLYAGMFAGGFYLLLKRINKEPSLWLLVVFLFIFHHTLSKGFYNFSFGIALFFWVVWSWLRFLGDRKNAHALIFFVVTGLLFFTQLLPFVFALITCGLLTVTFALDKGESDKGVATRYFFKNVIFLFVLSAPFLALMLWFTIKEGGMGLHLQPHLYRLKELVQFRYLVNAVHGEEFFAGMVGITLTSLLLFSVAGRFKGGFKVHRYDGLFLSFLFALFVCLFFPEDFMGRVILITMRAQLFVFILASCCIAYMLPLRWRDAGGVLLFTCFLCLSWVRFGYLQRASGAAMDYCSALQYIQPMRVVLPLDFDPAGRDADGKPVADRNYLFSHAADYMGAEKPLIMLDNYEANAGYFPLSWTASTNPYARLGRFEGIEGHPPCADIEAYTQTAGVSVDYLLFWCYDSSMLTKGHYAFLADQINRGYHEVYVSGSGRTVLYEKNVGVK